MKKVVAGICLASLLVVAGITAFAANRDVPKSAASTDSKTSENDSQAAVPANSVPADEEDAKLLLEINEVIFQVTQEAIQRPNDQRMTPDEISALIRSRIEELEARR